MPEKPIDINEVCAILKRRHRKGKEFSIVAVAEGAQFKKGQMVLQEKKLDMFGHVRLGGIGQTLAEKIEEKTGHETRVVVLGHIQRGGSPTLFDRILGTRVGVKAADLVAQGKFGRMAGLRGNEIIDVSLDQAVADLKVVTDDWWKFAEVFFK